MVLLQSEMFDISATAAEESRQAGAVSLGMRVHWICSRKQPRA